MVVVDGSSFDSTNDIFDNKSRNRCSSRRREAKSKYEEGSIFNIYQVKITIFLFNFYLLTTTYLKDYRIWGGDLYHLGWFVKGREEGVYRMLLTNI